MSAALRAIVALGLALLFNALGLLLLASLSVSGEPEVAPKVTEDVVEAPEVVRLPEPEPEQPPPPTPREIPEEAPQAPTPAPSELPQFSTLKLDGAMEVAIDPTMEENLDALFTDLSRTPTKRGGDGLFGAPGRDGGGVSDEPREASDVDEPPRPKLQMAARYPLRAEREGITGYVVLRGLVERDGRISRVDVVDARPAGVFEEAARSAFSQWRFSPGRHGGAPVRVWVRKRLEFKLR